MLPALEKAVRDSTERFRDQHRYWASQRAAKLPESFQRHVMAGWDARYGIPVDDKNSSPVALANRFGHEAVADFGAARCASAYDEEAIKTFAENYARMCTRCRSLPARERIAAQFGIEPPDAKKVGTAAAAARLDDPLWWRRQLRKVWTRASEDAMRRAGIIRKGRAPYASDEAVRHRTMRIERTAQWMRERVMVNGEGEQLNLIDLAEKSLANPALRRGEFMCRMRGFEELAKQVGHTGLFFTLTAPSAFHAQRSGGGVNPAWERADKPRVRDAQMWLRKRWEIARAKLARLSITYYGFRIAEPHHDATPHWHMVLFVAPSAAATLQSVLHGVWLSEYSEEPGAAAYRSKCITIDPAKGSAVGYIAKYVAKNIDGAGAIGEAIDDETGKPVNDSLKRVAAWAACYGIRQFQQIGGPPVGLWRELRRVREHMDSALLESVRAPADTGKWAEFVGALGGMDRAKRRVSSVRHKYRREMARLPQVLSEERGPRGGKRYRAARPDELPSVWMDREAPRAVDARGREVLAVTRYGETPSVRAAGVCSFGLLGRFNSHATRVHRWRIEKKCISSSIGRTATGGDSSARSEAEHSGSCGSALSKSGSFSDSRSDLGPVAITVRSTGASTSGDPMAWTSRETSMAGPH